MGFNRHRQPGNGEAGQLINSRDLLNADLVHRRGRPDAEKLLEIRVDPQEDSIPGMDNVFEREFQPIDVQHPVPVVPAGGGRRLSDRGDDDAKLRSTLLLAAPRVSQRRIGACVQVEAPHLILYASKAERVVAQGGFRISAVPVLQLGPAPVQLRLIGELQVSAPD